jgi:hypothetical protein
VKPTENEITKNPTDATTNIKSTFQSSDQQMRVSNANKAPEIDGDELNTPTTHNTTSDVDVEHQTGLSSISTDTINKMLIGTICQYIQKMPVFMFILMSSQV